MAARAASTGYSGTPLATKLGIKAGHRVVLVGAPAGFEAALAPLPPVTLARARSPRGRADVVVAFVVRRAELARVVAAAERAIAPDGALWIAWPKRASQVATEVTEDVVREVALPRGLVDNKVCAIDATWSGLRLVIRVERRAAAAAAAGAGSRAQAGVRAQVGVRARARPRR